jgi:hypothetical protein
MSTPRTRTTTFRAACTAGALVPAIVAGTAAGQIINGSFSDGLNGWSVMESGGSTMPGEVVVIDGKAVMRENDSFLTSLWQDFSLPSGASTLSFDLFFDAGFDTSDAFILDAFEISLLDATFASAVPTWAPHATSFLNFQEDGTVHQATGVSWDGTTATLDVSFLTSGTDLGLYFDLIGADADLGSEIRIDNVRFFGGGAVPLPSTPLLAVTGLASGLIAFRRRRT